MAEWSQNNKSIGIETSLDDSLGPDVIPFNFVLLSIKGGGSISELFKYSLIIASKKSDITASDLIGQKVSVWITDSAVTHHHISGVINRFSAGTKVQIVNPGTQMIKTVTIAGKSIQVLETAEPTMMDSDYYQFNVELVPGLWFLKKSSNCRVFQNKTALNIISEIIDFHRTDQSRPITVVTNLNNRGLPKLEYCVQYRESDYDFIARLAADNGLFFYFTHGTDAGNIIHTLYISNDKSFYGSEVSSGIIDSWNVEHAFTQPDWALRDFDYRKTQTNQIIKRGATNKLGSDQYDYPGDIVLAQLQNDIEALQNDSSADNTVAITDAEAQITQFKDAKLNARVDKEESNSTVVNGQSTSREFVAGHKFSKDSVTYVLTDVQILATENSYHNASMPASTFKNTFTAIPATHKYFSDHTKPKPIISGAQTAIVMGPEGQEVHTDKYGRVKVQFHWDRYTKNSCWLRVSQSWAGNGWGEMALPHIGHEVIVSFLEGDPDRPIITGRVYNEENKPPENPAANTKKYMLRDSADNEIKMDSSSSDKGIYISTDGTFDVNSDDIWSTTLGNSGSVGAGSTLSIFGGSSVDISGGITASIGVGLNYSVAIGGNYTYTLGYTNAYTHNAWINATNSDILNIAKEDIILGAGDQVCIVANCAADKQANRSIYYADNEMISLSIGESYELKKNIADMNHNDWYAKSSYEPSVQDIAVFGLVLFSGLAGAAAAFVSRMGSKSDGEKGGFIAGTSVAGSLGGIAYTAAVILAIKEWNDSNRDRAIEPIVHKKGEAEAKIELNLESLDTNGINIYAEKKPIAMSFGEEVDSSDDYGIQLHSKARGVKISTETGGEGSRFEATDEYITMCDKKHKAFISINTEKNDGRIFIDNESSKSGSIRISSKKNILISAGKGDMNVKIKSKSFGVSKNFKVLA